MNWSHALTLLLYLFVVGFCEMHQDHIILWTSEEQFISDSQTALQVREGDNIIFICPKGVGANQQLFWTYSLWEFDKCNLTMETKNRKLLDCGDRRSGPDFILKVSQFSEISQLPTFHRNLTVYFVSQPEYCLRYKLKLAIRRYNSEVETQGTGSKSSILKMPNPQPDDEQPDSSFQSTKHDSEKSVWIRYRFLFIPGILGFLIMIGFQAAVCALGKKWYSRSNESGTPSRHTRSHRCDLSQWYCTGCSSCRLCTMSPERVYSKENQVTPSKAQDSETAERSKAKRVEFTPDHLHSSKPHSQMGIGTMPKHLIPQHVVGKHPIINVHVSDHSITDLGGWSKTCQSTEQNNLNRHSNSQSINEKLHGSDCVGNIQRCCSDRPRYVQSQSPVTSVQPCVFTDECNAYIVPVTDLTQIQASKIFTKDDDKQSEIIHISV